MHVQLFMLVFLGRVRCNGHTGGGKSSSTLECGVRHPQFFESKREVPPPGLEPGSFG